MGTLASQITSLTIVYTTVYSGADQRKHQSSASLAFVRGNHRWPMNSPDKWPVTRKMFPFDDFIMLCNPKHETWHNELFKSRMLADVNHWSQLNKSSVSVQKWHNLCEGIVFLLHSTHHINFTLSNVDSHSEYHIIMHITPAYQHQTIFTPYPNL